MASERAREFFDGLWRDGDPWELETSDYDRESYDRQLALLGGRRYRYALELGCAAGAFTERLAGLCDSVLAVDVSAGAIGRARERGLPPTVEWRVADAIELDPVDEGPFDLVVVSETIYYLGWLNPFYDVAWLAHRLAEALEPGGRLLLANTILGDEQGLETPWLIWTYRDLFRNVGLELEREERLAGEKGGAAMEALISLFRKG